MFAIKKNKRITVIRYPFIIYLMYLSIFKITDIAALPFVESKVANRSN